MATYKELEDLSIAISKKISIEVGATAVALYVCGGHGVLPRVFRVVKLPKEQFPRETRGGSASASLLAYARRKGIAEGYSPLNRFDAIPVAWAEVMTFIWKGRA